MFWCTGRIYWRNLLEECTAIIALECEMYQKRIKNVKPSALPSTLSSMANKAFDTFCQHNNFIEITFLYIFAVHGQSTDPEKISIPILFILIIKFVFHRMNLETSWMLKHAEHWKAAERSNLPLVIAQRKFDKILLWIRSPEFVLQFVCFSYLSGQIFLVW